MSRFFAWAKYSISPPEKIYFVPEENTEREISPTEPFFTPTPSVNLDTDKKAPEIVATATIAPTPIPAKWELQNFRHEYQSWNNCGPATLSMALSYWGWVGDQRPIAAGTKPNPRDKNVMPYELADYVDEETPYDVIWGTGGEIALVKEFVAAGLPVIVEKGFEGPDFESWMGHYVLVTGYSDMDQTFTIQDSYNGPDQVVGYEELNQYWRAFNYAYLVVFPEQHSEDVLDILGPLKDQDYRERHALEMASDEIYSLSGRDLFFAWFNRGSSLVALQDYAGAALAYDEAFQIYPSIPEQERPWRILWYQTGPYWAYYYTGRYQDVINLSTTTLNAMSEPVLEESYYWRAKAHVALGNTEDAVMDLQTSLELHPEFLPAKQLYQSLEN